MDHQVYKKKTWTQLKALITTTSPLDYHEKDGYYKCFVQVGDTEFFTNLYESTHRYVKGMSSTNATDYTDFVNNYKTAIDSTPPSTNKAVTINDQKNIIKTEAKKTNASSAIIATHNFCDPCTWYGDSVEVTDEVLSDSGDGLTFNSNHINWIDLTHSRMTNELDLAADYPVVIKVDDVTAQCEETAYATAAYEGVTYTADRVGPRGNDISLVFDGTDNIQTVVDAWNTTYWYNKVSHNGTGTTVPTAGTVNLKAGDYTVDYENGDVTFYSSQSGNTIKASYFYENGGTYYLQPDSGKQLEITKSEVQFTKDVKLHSALAFEIWVYNPQDLPNKILYQKEAYKTIRDFICTGNLGQGEIPQINGVPTAVVVFPYDYASLKILKSSVGAEVRITLEENVKLEGTLGNATFYLITEDES